MSCIAPCNVVVLVNRFITTCANGYSDKFNHIFWNGHETHFAWIETDITRTTKFSFLVQKSWLMAINFYAGFTEVLDVFWRRLNFTGDFILNLQKCQRYLSLSCADFLYKILRHCFHPGANSEYFCRCKYKSSIASSSGGSRISQIAGRGRGG